MLEALSVGDRVNVVANINTYRGVVEKLDEEIVSVGVYSLVWPEQRTHGMKFRPDGGYIPKPSDPPGPYPHLEERDEWKVGKNA